MSSLVSQLWKESCILYLILDNLTLFELDNFLIIKLVLLDEILEHLLLDQPNFFVFFGALVDDLIDLESEFPEDLLCLSELGPEIFLEWVRSFDFVVKTFSELTVEINLILRSAFFKDHLAFQSVVANVSCQVGALGWEAYVDCQVLFLYLALLIRQLEWITSALAVTEHVSIS